MDDDDILRYSTTSELLKDNTFEAEMLMELHTFHDYKERLLHRLRNEERDLRQIIKLQKELIQEYGVSISQQDETKISGINLDIQDIENNLIENISARGFHDKAHMKMPIYSSGSATNLLAELDKELAAATRIASTESDEHRSTLTHSFAQSRQNYFKIPNSETIIEKLRDCDDFDSYFSNYPIPTMISANIFDSSSFPTEQILQVIDDFTQKRRMDFLNVFLAELRKNASFSAVLEKISSIKSSYELTKVCEKYMSPLFGVPRCIYLIYETKTETLVFVKQKVQLRFPVKQGLFQKSLFQQIPLYIERDNPEFSQTDKSILQASKNAYVLPVLNIRSQFIANGLLVLFDFKSDITPVNKLRLSILARYIAIILPQVHKFEEKSLRTDTFKNAIDNFVSLCKTNNISTIVSNITVSFASFFKCENVKLYKVNRKNHTYAEFTRYETFGKEYSFDTGIVGLAITTRKPQNVAKPQFHGSYNSEVDCFDENSFSSSLLACPIYDDTGETHWVIALYNKNNSLSFSSLDQETLRVMCDHMLPVLESSFKNEKLKKTVNNSKKNLAKSEVIFDVISSLKNLNDIQSLVLKMKQSFLEQTKFKNITLYLKDKFRNELISFDSKNIDIIDLNTDLPEAECVKAGRIIDNWDPETDRGYIVFPIRDSTCFVVGVVKLKDDVDESASKIIANNHQPQENPSLTHRKRSSLSLISSLSLSLSSSRFPLKDSNHYSYENLSTSDEDEALKMTIATWQKIAGLVIECSGKESLCNRKRNILKLMNNILNSSVLNTSFRVWQEIQFVASNFGSVESNTVKLELPEVKDLVYMKHEKSSEKIVSFLRSLGRMQDTDFSSNNIILKTSNAFNSRRSRIVSAMNDSLLKSIDMTIAEVEEDDTEIIGEFLITAAIDFTKSEEEFIMRLVTKTLHDYGVQKFLTTDREVLDEFVFNIRSMHPNNVFRGWRLAVDHFQFASWLLSNTALLQNLKDTEIAATLLYLLSMYSDPSSFTEDRSIEKRVKYSLESSGLPSPLSALLIASSMTGQDILCNSDERDRHDFLRILEELNSMINHDEFTDVTDACSMLFLVSLKSYMMRESDVTKSWIHNRMLEEIPYKEADIKIEMMSDILELERDTVSIPIIDSIVQFDSTIEFLKERMLMNYSLAIKR